MRRLLLVSTSTTHRTEYLEHCAPQIQELFHTTDTREVLFIPYALHDRDSYAEKARRAFSRMGLELDSIHHAADPVRAVEDSAGIFIGGGNTFRLLKTLYDLSLLDCIRERVLRGVPYLGTSAGSNVACPTIKTTNDMPIVYPPSLEALGLVSFQINAHYLDPDPDSTHMGETRETRIKEFHEENETPVVGLREGAMLRVHDHRVELDGRAGARICLPGQEFFDCDPGVRIDKSIASRQPIWK